MTAIDDALRSFTSFMDSGPPLPFTLAMLLLVSPVLSLGHELGHAAAALVLLPGRVLVAIGGRRPLVTGEVGRMTVTFHPLMLPWRFDAICAYEALPSRAEAIMIALAGPAASLITGIVTWSAFTHVGPGLVHDLLGVMTFASFFTVAICLVPMSLTDSRGMRLRTDGAIVIAALR